jgi:hypothetical protein
MKKTMLITALVLLALVALGVGVAFAQGPQPPAQDGYGWIHEYVERALAAQLGLSEQQVEDQLASGQTMVQIALDYGIKQEDLANFMNEVHKEAFTSAVKDGVTTQAQADWMLQRMQNRSGYGIGNCPMHNGQGAPFGRGPGVGSGMMQNRGSGYGPGMMGGWGPSAQNP